ncbi:MAG: hypothetical protein OXC69_05085 [Candidatus Tectomicrobia bacterium]|nr:hypothetical protein [Candidatus Tectomicrobia bacterium]
MRFPAEDVLQRPHGDDELEEGFDNDKLHNGGDRDACACALNADRCMFLISNRGNSLDGFRIHAEQW